MNKLVTQIANRILDSLNLQEIMDICVAELQEESSQRQKTEAQLQELLREREENEQKLQRLNQELEAKVAERTNELWQVNHLQQTILNSADYSIIATDTQGYIQAFNTAAERMLGYSAKELIGKSTPEAFHDLQEVIQRAPILSEELGEEIPLGFEVFVAKARRDIVCEEEWTYIRKDGSRFPVLLSITSLKDANQKITGFLGVAKDISDRKLAEQERQQLLQELSAFKLGLDQSAIVAITNAQGVMTYVNDQFCEISGYSRDELIGQTHRIVKSDYHPPEFFQNMWRTIVKGKVWRGEICNQTKQGNLYWMESTIVPFLDGQGRPVKYLAIRFDITIRKQAEISLTNYAHEIEDLYNNAPCGYHSLDRNGCYVQVNDTELKWLGYSREELIGRRFQDFLSESSIQIFRHNYPIFKQRGWVSDIEYELVGKNGNLLPVSLSATSVYDSDGNYVYSRSTLFDIRERKEYEEKLQQTNQELMKVTRLKDEFLTSMSHELRTPLNAILGLTESLLDGVFGEISNRGQKMLKIIERSGNHLLELINDILDLAKIESGKVSLEFAPANIEILCQSSMLFIRQQAAQKNLQLKEEIPPLLPDLLIDERRIRQVLINLLNNAMKFTPEEGCITLKVTVEPTPNSNNEPQQWLRFAVIDNGIGISDDNLQKLFQPFVQVDSSLNRKYAGTGLGLSLVKRIVEMHGGKVQVTSEVGVGSSFMIDLPCPDTMISSVKRSPSNSPDATASDPSQIQGAPLILIADDNEMNVMTICSYLEAKGYRIMVAKDGQEAINLVQSAHPNLVVMDIQMPVIDGLEAIKRLRASEFQDLPIIAVTALAMTGDRERCLEAGANEYLSKPIKLKQLAKIIQQTLSS
ncbi:hybrid sensor histidine kinase/response regulator [Pseudanabaena yagii]|uniref:histidine kinase n=1 Tax=Pseudanabaena yagii GIHE-NHR1 TaxID=2722753 RepID=A0ABX1LMU7_9CYAN|nr:PAS domain S-box protein [Pseudanabaena yagii]NMF56623.1 PAS domain S-box protein [Pseudanabaena yagii GIHE-NHR1]